MAGISVAIITKNEEDNIARCITSVKAIADEIVVVDSNSEDQTVKIAESLGARCIIQPFLGYIEQKNFALEQCTKDYVLSLDADEALSEELQASIVKNKEQLSGLAYSFNRLTNIGEVWIKHSGWYPDKKVRLFKKGGGKWGGTNPHDKFVLNDEKAQVHHLTGDLLHYSFKDLKDHHQQSIRFAEISAISMKKQGKKANILHLIIKPLAAFVKCYFIKGGFMDLRYGLPIARIAASTKYLKYQKLRTLTNGAS